MIEFTNTQSRMFLTTIDLYRKRSKKVFENLYNKCDKIQINGLHTHLIPGPRYSQYGFKLSGSRYNGTDIFDKCGAILLLDDVYYKAVFPVMQESKITFYTNNDGDLCYILMYELNIIQSTTDKGCIDGSYTFVIETILPDIDVVSPKLMM